MLILFSILSKNINYSRCPDDQKSINSFNFDVNELKQPKMSTKTLQKGTTGGSKRVRPLRDMSAPFNDRDNQFGSVASNGFSALGQGSSQDLNLASTSNQRSNSKSSSTKLFDDLKENVYLEVSALIAANESRPHFLINLFRELRQHCESNGSPNILPDMQASVSNVQVCVSKILFLRFFFIFFNHFSFNFKQLFFSII